jgi:hypothetical protein
MCHLVDGNTWSVFWYPFKKPGQISEVCVEQENALDSNFGNFLPQNIEMIRFLHFILWALNKILKSQMNLTMSILQSLQSH